MTEIRVAPTTAPAAALPAGDATGRVSAVVGPPVGAGSPAPAPDPAGMTRFYMTSDLRAATGLTRTHLDFYLREGLIVPTARTESGYLLFDTAELATLRGIIADRQAGLGTREIRRRLGR